jgi:hypothetical protein
MKSVRILRDRKTDAPEGRTATTTTNEDHTAMTDAAAPAPEQTQKAPACTHEDLCAECRADAAHAAREAGFDAGYDAGYGDGYEAALEALRPLLVSPTPVSSSRRAEIGSTDAPTMHGPIH